MKFVAVFTMLMAPLLCLSEVNLEGLWLVEKVEVGDQSMTPNGKWTRFKKDGSQTSGNGWKQHSIGHWELEGNELTLTTENTASDPFGPFTIVQSATETMTWERVEEGMKVKVILRRITELPTTNADLVLGLWEREEVLDSCLLSTGASLSVHLRWDNMCVVTIDGTRHFGIYRIHGHKPQIEWIPYSSEIENQTWTFEFDSDGNLILNGESGPLVRLIRG